MNTAPDPAPDPVPEIAVRRPWGRSHWALFLAAMFGPPVLTMLAAMMDNRGAAAPALTFLGGGAGGIVVGVMLGCRLGGSTVARVGLSIILAIIAVLGVVTLCCFGCGIGNYKLEFR